MNNDYAIEANGLSKHFGDLKAVSNLDLKVPRGQIYGFSHALWLVDTNGRHGQRTRDRDTGFSP
jgi:ABC-type uncharacterized transport system ATPase subunit